MTHLDTLIHHQQWRRGAEIEMLPPAQIGKAIDYAIAVIQAAQQTLTELGHLADGEQCTLKVLRDAVEPDWRSHFIDEATHE